MYRGHVKLQSDMGKKLLIKRQFGTYGPIITKSRFKKKEGLGLLGPKTFSDLQVASPAGPARHLYLWSASESLTAGPNVR